MSGELKAGPSRAVEVLPFARTGERGREGGGILQQAAAFWRGQGQAVVELAGREQHRPDELHLCPRGTPEYNLPE
ncbi:hypothetical protein Nmel_003607 [Mimus melanotis]